MPDINLLSDEDLIKQSQSGDNIATDALLIRYKALVGQLTRSYYINGAEQGDLIQEGMIGLFKAIRDYTFDKSTAFKSFANLCIRRQIIDAMKSANRNKNIPLNSSLSLDLPVMADIVSSKLYDNPENAMVQSEDHKNLTDNINNVLSKYEIKILNLFLLKKTYIEIAEIVGKDSKSIDNALQRIKSKIKVLIN